jgi:hypothetical protein
MQIWTPQKSACSVEAPKCQAHIIGHGMTCSAVVLQIRFDHEGYTKLVVLTARCCEHAVSQQAYGDTAAKCLCGFQLKRLQLDPPVLLSCLYELPLASPLDAAAGHHSPGWHMPQQQLLLLHKPGGVPPLACGGAAQTAQHGKTGSNQSPLYRITSSILVVTLAAIRALS